MLPVTEFKFFLGITEFYLVFDSILQFYRVLPSFTEFFSWFMGSLGQLPSFHGFFFVRMIVEAFGVFSDLQGFRQ